LLNKILLMGLGLFVFWILFSLSTFQRKKKREFLFPLNSLASSVNFQKYSTRVQDFKTCFRF
jgi:hypothetical protein